MGKKPVITVEKLRKAAISARRSTLYVWLLEHYAEVDATVEEAGRPNWTALAATFADAGLTDAHGNRPTAEGTRQTWWKVRQAQKTRAAKPPVASAKAPAPTPAAPKRPLPDPV